MAARLNRASQTPSLVPPLFTFHFSLSALSTVFYHKSRGEIGGLGGECLGYIVRFALRHW